MSLSTAYSTPIDLYCNEAGDDVLSTDTDSDISEINNSTYSDFPVDNESFLDSIFNIELDQMPETKLVRQFLQLPENIVTARNDAVNWMLEVHTYYKFRPETAYLSVNYLDRFLSCHSLPEGKEWPLQLLAVACISLAAKLEETRVPLLLDIQILKPKFLFTPSTVQSMELLVMASLKWRLHLITPFYFLQCFISKLSYLSPNCNNFSSIFLSVSNIIIYTCRAISFLHYTPSTIAAAAVLWAANQIIDDVKLGCLHKRVNKEMVKRCYDFIERNMSQLSNGEDPDATKCHA